MLGLSIIKTISLRRLRDENAHLKQLCEKQSIEIQAYDTSFDNHLAEINRLKEEVERLTRKRDCRGRYAKK